GLRPVTPDGLPILDKLKDGAVVATAHYRNGVLLTPMTARVVAALVLGEMPPVDLTSFSASRR
ncbi:MAG TPA: FAD-dependent oxidoreductase, partial [Myxococcales bacterium]|nr:FAD-dependent oxidoreductase [Myxococcales bacterium]